MKQPIRTVLRDIEWNRGYASFACAILTMVLMPVYFWFLPPVMILWGISWILENRKHMKQVLIRDQTVLILFILFIAFFAWQLAGMIYSDNADTGWRKLTIRFSLVLFPLILLSPGEMILKSRKYLLQIFAGSTFFYILFCFCNAFVKSLNFYEGTWTFNPHPVQEYWLNYFYGSYFSAIHHPSYLSMYVLLSALIAFEFWYDHSLGKGFRLILLIMGVLLLGSLYFLSSRAGLVAVVLIIPTYFFIKYRKKGIWQISWLAILMFTIGALLVIRTNDRMQKFMKDLAQKSISEIVQTDERSIIWKTSIKIIRDHYLWGLGTGDVEAKLVDEYLRSGNVSLAERKMNTHNQYFEVILENGIIGLALFLAIFGCMLYLAWKEKEVLFGVYILMMLLFFMFETMLNRFAGVSFFALFSFLLLNNNSNVRVVARGL
ncbi:MAG: O-antigen ligase family protein [Bacteroidales bacterium]|nr:MAG: O-antigen ligase family protein [Bacteroidales bacterium]